MINNNLVEVKNNTVVVSSRQIAEHFGKEHRSVLKSIKDLLLNIEGLHNFEHTPEMFQKATYIHEQNKKEYPMYLMNRDGFSLLVMGFTGKEALEWKIKYIKAFNEMEQQLTNQHYTDEEVKQLADEYYHYKMEALRGYLIRGYLQAKITENNKIVPDDVNTIMRFIRTNLSSKYPSRCVLKDF